MDKYNCCGERENVFLLNQINDFFHACNIEIDDSLWKRNDYGILTYNKEENNSINYIRKYNFGNGKYHVIIGRYNNLDLLYIIGNKVMIISLCKTWNQYNFFMDIELSKSSLAKYELKSINNDNKLLNKITFYTAVNDHNIIMKTVNNFLNNPEKVFDKYHEIIHNKKTIFSYEELKSAIDNTEKNDFFAENTEKKIKMIANKR